MVNSPDEASPPRLAATRHAGDYEYAPLRLDGGISRASATTMLSIQAEYAGWELAQVLKFADGSRQITLRRKRPRGLVPGLTA